MTNNEAIKWLKRIRINYPSRNIEHIESDVALHMAIKALKQEPILDKIRAEIEKWHKEGTNWSDIRLMEIEDILNKYKAESEDKE